MEEIGTTNPEYQPLRVLWHRSCAHARKHPFNRNSSYLHCVRNSWSKDPSNPFLSFCVAPIQTTSFHQNNYYAEVCTCRFFLLSLFYFHCTACVTPGNYYLKYSFSTYTYLPCNSLISSWIPTKFVSVLLLCMLYHTNNFQHKANSLIYLRGTFTLLVNSFRNLDPLRII